ncbi:MAG: butyrate kinase [Myxococcota bacterium]
MSNSFKTILDTASEITRATTLISANKRKIEQELSRPLAEIRKKLAEGKISEDEKSSILSELKALLNALLSSPRNLRDHGHCGDLLTLITALERQSSQSQGIMNRFLTRESRENFTNNPPQVLVINPGSTSTKIARFKGNKKTHEFEIHLSPDSKDNVQTRTDSILNWMHKNQLSLHQLSGISCRGGFIHPVPSGTYKITSVMLEDLKQPEIEHASNMAIMIGRNLARYSDNKDDILLTTSDPVVCDEMEMVERITGFIKIKMDGTGAHYLNHKAVHSFIASILNEKKVNLNGITAHIGGGSSLARHKNGRVTGLINAFSGIPSANRSGKLDLPRVIKGIENNEITLKELKKITYSQGGLLSLAGTNDFRALSSFVKRGATEEQREKINLLFKFYARQIAQGIFKLMGDGEDVDFVAVTGGLARSSEISSQLYEILSEHFTLVFVPGSLEHESLAAGLMNGLNNPGYLKNYLKERDKLAEKRKKQNSLLDTTIFKRKILYRKHGSPIKSLDQLVDSTVIKVQENYSPVVAIIGADNEDAILAAKRANQQGSYRIAKFILIGDYEKINRIAYDYDLVIDNDNFTIEDHENPIDRGIELYDQGKIHILMKGSLHTDEILRGVFRYLKKSGKLKPGELISHSVVMDIPTRNKLAVISDAAVNPYPDTEKRIKIIENNLKVAKYLNLSMPKVAILSAIENINKSVASSIEADKISGRFADRKDCIVEGPLSFDVAMNSKIAKEKKYSGQIQGNADILIVPDIDAGNILYKSLTTQSNAVCAGIILCGDIPIILTSRGDSARSKLASIGLSVISYFHS